MDVIVPEAEWSVYQLTYALAQINLNLVSPNL